VAREKLHNKELYNLYSSPNIVRMIKSWRKRWAGHVIHAYKTLIGGEILKWILGKQDGGVWTGFIWPHQWQALVNTE
jgi:hypothetical protein